MGFWSLFEVASMPILEVLIISVLGAFMSTQYFNLLPSDARRYLNKIVYVAFTPSLVFGSLARTVSLQDIISWWFMPVNIGITFLLGGTFGWIVVQLLQPKPHLRYLIIAMCSSGNLGNILLIIIPAICKEEGNPFRGSKLGLSYVSFSMALGAFYIWTYTYHLMRKAGTTYQDFLESKVPNNDLEALLLNKNDSESSDKRNSLCRRILGTLHNLGEELRTPPIIAAILGLIFGSVTFLRKLIIGSNAPLRVIDDSIRLLGDGTIPSITLILGGNLTQGLGKGILRPVEVIAVICVRYLILPAFGIVVVKTASNFGFLPSDPLFHFVLLIQFTLPPAMNIGTMAQLFNVAQEECSILFLWTYLVAALALTGWSTVFMWILS